MFTVKEALSKHFRYDQELIEMFVFCFQIVPQFQLKPKLLYDNNAVTYFVQPCSFHKNELQLLISRVHYRVYNRWRSANNWTFESLSSK